ncbi:MAG TPA: hypothetical protein VMM76_28750 [Pirellulaceae bacterium]|nr:hypothetical protein [Pirellulaceae bacterium]
MTSQHDKPKRWQFGLRGIAAVSGLIALWAAGLGTGHRMYLQGLFTVSWAAMLLSLLAIHFRPIARAFWGGFALFGWTYILFQFTDLFDDRTRGYFFTEVVGPLIADLLPESGTEASRGGWPFRWFVGTACKIALILPVAYAGGLLSDYCFGTNDSRDG